MGSASFVCAGRVLRTIAADLGVTFYTSAGGGQRPQPVTADDALETNVLGPLVAIQAERIWQTAFSSFGVSSGTRYRLAEESLNGICADWPLIGNDVLSTYRMLVLAKAAEQLFDWETRRAVEVEQIQEWYRGTGAYLADGALIIPGTADWAPVSIRLFGLEDAQIQGARELRYG